MPAENSSLQSLDGGVNYVGCEPPGHGNMLSHAYRAFDELVHHQNSLSTSPVATSTISNGFKICDCLKKSSQICSKPSLCNTIAHSNKDVMHRSHCAKNAHPNWEKPSSLASASCKKEKHDYQQSTTMFSMKSVQCGARNQQRILRNVAQISVFLGFVPITG